MQHSYEKISKSHKKCGDREADFDKELSKYKKYKDESHHLEKECKHLKEQCKDLREDLE